jgi:predicted amidohydrolase YtcJ
MVETNMNHRRQIISGGKIFTANPEQPWADVLVVEDSTILAVGSSQLITTHESTTTDHLILDGGLVVPGFVDGHVHVAMTGASMLKAQLQGAGNLQEIRKRLIDWANANPDEPRVLGTNWVHSDLPNAIPTKEMLDDIFPDRPVYLEAFDFHSSWLNSAALRELGITIDTPNPVGGRFVRDETTGEATGYLLENASVNYVWTLLNNISEQVVEQHITTALDAFVRAGITSVVEMALEEPALKAMERLRTRGKLPIRIAAHMIIWRTGNPEEELDFVNRAIELAKNYQNDFLRITGIKIIADGTIDNCTAALSKPYSNGESSGPIWDSQALMPVIAAADAAGLQTAIHAIGDAAITMAVDSIENAMRVNGTSHCRHRIEHLEYALQKDIDRMGALNITASMQPVHVNPEYLENWAAMLGPDRANQGWAWPLYQAAGSTLAFGTDTPTAPYLPLINMYLASTRKSPTHPDIPALRPDWSLTLAQAIEAGTRESAWAAKMDHLTGQLKPGLAADLVVLDRDVINEGPQSLLDTNVKITMINGKIIYSK